LVAVAVVVGVVVLGTPLPEVEVAPVTRGAWERVVEEDGRARVRDRFAVSSPLGGTLERLALHVGDCVAQGDTLATLHPGPPPLLDARSRAELEARRRGADASLASARTLLERADAARAHAEDELERARKLGQQGALPARDREHAELEAVVARREREAARFAVNVARHEREMIGASLEAGQADPSAKRAAFLLRAPIDGCVLRVHNESETVIAPGAPILELATPGAIEVVVDLLSTDAVRVRPGTEATLYGFGADDSIRGSVRLVEPTAKLRISALGVEEERVDVVVDPIDKSDGWRRVGDGYRVDVRLAIERLEATLRVPTGALFRDGSGWAAFTLEAGRARRVRVDVARYGPVLSAVRAGLREGASVVVEPPEDLADGARIKAR
jgi:HlyD family secretion protein